MVIIKDDVRMMEVDEQYVLVRQVVMNNVQKTHKREIFVEMLMSEFVNHDHDDHLEHGNVNDQQGVLI